MPPSPVQCSEMLVSELDDLVLCDIITVLEAAYSVDESGPLFKKVSPGVGMWQG